MGDNPQNGNDSKVDVNLDDSDTDESEEDDGFDHPDDVPVTDPDDLPEVNSAEDAVDGDQDRLEKLQKKAEEMQEEAEEEEKTADDMVPEDSDGTPVDLGDDEIPEQANMGEAIEKAHNDPDSDFDAGEMAENLEEETEEVASALGGEGTQTAAQKLQENTSTPDEDNVSQASDSLFTDEEAEQVEEEYGDQFELETLDDVPDDFDYEDQDTTHYGAEQEADIKHNGVVFKLAQPEGAKEDKFWNEIQNKNTLAGIFDTLIKYGVERPKDIQSRMEEENWTGFAKAGLAMKISSFLGLDSLQDF